MPERLVLLSGQDAPAELADLQARYRVSGLLPPRLAIVDLDDSQAELVGRRPGIRILSDPEQALPDSLGETEQLFAHAWQQRLRSIHKQRPGDGLAWDAPGFTPPDPPP
jgi:hypothetical protein